MSFDLYDFAESLDRVSVPKTRPEHCSFAFGRSPEGYGSWEGGFVCHTRSGKPWIFIFGWCDTTGWGCQDGAYLREYDHQPSMGELDAAWREEFDYSAPLVLHADEKAPYGDAWDEADFDEDPADLNRYLAGELDVWGKPAVASREGRP